MSCPHTKEPGWPVDADDFYAHTHCDHEDHEADVDDSKPLPRREGLNPSGPKFF